MAFHRGPIVVTDGLVLSLDMANSKSFSSLDNSWKDLSSQGNNGTFINQPTYDSGDNGSIVFDGVDDYVSIPGTGILDFGVNDTFTIETWVNIQAIPDSGNTSAICSKGVCCGIDWYFPSPSSVRFRAGIRNSTDGQQTFGSSEDRNINQWYHLLFTYTPNQSEGMKLYVDGNLDASLSSVGLSEFSDNTKSFIIGGNASLGGTARYSNIKSSVVRMYNKSLTTLEVLQNYNATKSRFGL